MGRRAPMMSCPSCSVAIRKVLFVQVVLIDVVAEQQHVVGAVLIQVDRFSPIAEAGGRFVVNDCERLFLSGKRIEDEHSL